MNDRAKVSYICPEISGFEESRYRKTNKNDVSKYKNKFTFSSILGYMPQLVGNGF